jgi:hypothetical protein
MAFRPYSGRSGTGTGRVQAGNTKKLPNSPWCSCVSGGGRTRGVWDADQLLCGAHQQGPLRRRLRQQRLRVPVLCAKKKKKHGAVNSRLAAVGP